MPKRSSVSQLKALCQKKRRILKFCAFAKKNAVSLTNQGCKGCQNEALCHKPKLCAINQSKLSKNSAQAEFLCFCTRLLVKHEFPDAKAKLCAINRPLTHKYNTFEFPDAKAKLCAINRPLTHKYNTLLVLFPDKLVLFPDKLRYNY